jgi:cysteine-rich repeat protein
MLGCLTETAIDCPQGQLCPAGTVCRDDGSCAPEASVIACEGKGDAEPCATSAGAGVCADGVCVAAGCGNGVREPSELCDDGNQLAGDGCSADCASDESCGNELVDPLRGEQCDDGPGLSGDGCSSACQSEIPAWRVWSPPSFEPYTTAAMTYDIDQRRAILLAIEATFAFDGDGWTAVAPRLRSDYQFPPMLAYDASRRATFAVTVDDDVPVTWRLDGSTWVAVDDAPRLVGGTMAYADAQGGIVAVGGDEGGEFATYLFDDGGWHALAPLASPPVRANPGLAYDPVAGELVMACGTVADAWRFDGTTWAAIAAPACGNGSSRRGMTYDAGRGGVVLVGAGIANLQLFDGASWSSEPLAFGAVNLAAAAYLPLVDGIIAAGYQTVMGFGGAWTYADVYEWPHEAPGLVYDSSAGTIVRFGGAFGDGDSTFNDLGRFDGESWSYLEGWSGDVERPVSRTMAAMVYDDARERIVLFGGRDWDYKIVGDTWVRDAAGWVARPGAGATPRQDAGVAYDRARGEVVLFGGGVIGADQYTPAANGDTYVLRDEDWIPLEVSPAPSPRMGPLMAYDPRREVVVLWGGYVDPTPNAPPYDDLEVLTDTWEFDGAAWTEIAVEGPPGRVESAMAYDEAAGVMVVFGGNVDQGDGTLRPSADHWTYDGSAWREIRYAQASPPIRYAHRMAYDARRRRMVVAGSVSENTVLELWNVNGVGLPEASRCEGRGDDDGDGLEGCDDPDCAGACTPACPPLDPDCEAARWCGDGTCDPALEDRRLCAVDCDRCGDGVCAWTFEDDVSCPMDCGRCGDGACAAPESSTTCPGDCPAP